MLPERFKEVMLSLAKGGEGSSGGEFPPVLLAVSGGIDSMTMAHLFKISDYPSFAVATVNFSLRGEESDGDEMLVRRWCEERGVECFSIRFNTEVYASEKGISTQMAARDLRYGWFSELCAKKGYKYLAVAHNLNDKAETLFINLLRGTGIKGLLSIKERSTPAGSEMEVIRPMLGFTREEIDKFAKIEGIPYRDDSTNFESHYSRNKIRNLVFPVFSEINPSFLQTLEREISIFTQANSVIESRFAQVRAEALSVMTGGEESVRVSVDVLKRVGNGEFWLYMILEEFGFSHSVLCDIWRSIDSESGKIFYSSDYQLLKDRSYLIVRRRPDRDSAQDKIEASVSVKIFEIYEGFKPTPSDRLFYLDADLTGDNIIFRNWRDGDRFKPLGMDGTKKVSDYLTDVKRDRFTKEKRVVATTADDRIFCLVGERIDHNFRITTKTKRVLEIKVL